MLDVWQGRHGLETKDRAQAQILGRLIERPKGGGGQGDAKKRQDGLSPVFPMKLTLQSWGPACKLS